jgi:hypothetical protein
MDYQVTYGIFGQVHFQYSNRLLRTETMGCTTIQTETKRIMLSHQQWKTSWLPAFVVMPYVNHLQGS